MDPRLFALISEVITVSKSTISKCIAHVFKRIDYKYIEEHIRCISLRVEDITIEPKDVTYNIQLIFIIDELPNGISDEVQNDAEKLLYNFIQYDIELYDFVIDIEIEYKCSPQMFTYLTSDCRFSNRQIDNSENEKLFLSTINVLNENITKILTNKIMVRKELSNGKGSL